MAYTGLAVFYFFFSIINPKGFPFSSDVIVFGLTLGIGVFPLRRAAYSSILLVFHDPRMSLRI
jgi:hypothetical protein